MGWYDKQSEEYEAHEAVTKRKADLSHELLAGAASFYAAKKYEDHVAEKGKPDDHALAKELIAGAVGAFIDREVETRGLDFFDKQKAKHEAKKRAEQALAESGDY